MKNPEEQQISDSKILVERRDLLAGAATLAGSSLLGLALPATTAAADLPQDRMPPIPADKMTDAQNKAAAEILSGPRKAVVGPFIPLLRSPELMSRLQKVGEYLRFNTKLGSNMSEFIILQMARHMTQQFEWDSHADLALKAGVKQETITAIAEGRGGRGDSLRILLGTAAAPMRERCRVRAGGKTIRRARRDRYHSLVRLLHDAGVCHERGKDSAAAGKITGSSFFPAVIKSLIRSRSRAPLQSRLERRVYYCFSMRYPILEIQWEICDLQVVLP